MFLLISVGTLTFQEARTHLYFQQNAENCCSNVVIRTIPWKKKIFKESFRGNLVNSLS